jgi:hypothetical protein
MSAEEPAISGTFCSGSADRDANRLGTTAKMSSLGAPPTAFCNHCGYPPAGPWWSSAHRVCTRCGHGIVLLAAPGAGPSIFDPFVIVDERLTIRAVSRHAKVVLGIKTWAVFGIALGELLVAEGDDRPPETITLAIADTTACCRTVALQTPGNPVLRFSARVSACGPPRAALIVLTPVCSRVVASAPHGRPTLTARRTDQWCSSEHDAAIASAEHPLERLRTRGTRCP